MIISRTPLRMSFVGGGTDLPAFYQEEPGAVVSTAINKYIYITVNKKFDSQVRASYSQTEIVEKASQLEHELIRESLKKAGVSNGVEITSLSDIPSSGTGLGSSSSYTVGLLNALSAYKGRHVDAKRLAEEACEIELNILGKPIGKQDQYAAAFGGFQYYQFNPDGTVFVDPIVTNLITKKALDSSLIMFYTGVTRSANDILKEQSRNIVDDQMKRRVLRQMKQQADEMRRSLQANNLDAFGEVLHAGWLLKKQLAGGISNKKIDGWYELARQNGAIGGKLLGAGGGGFFVFYAHPDRHQAITKALKDLRPFDFRFEPQGSKIIFVEE